MSKNKKKYTNIVYSTNPNFEYEELNENLKDTISPENQKLYVYLDRKNRGGKDATIVEGFQGIDQDLKELGKLLKSKCGVGGSVKDEVILIQGNFKEKVYNMLIELGYSQTKKKGG